MIRGVTLALAAVCGACSSPAGGRDDSRFPRVQIVPQPDDQLSFQLDGREILRYHGSADPRPYFFPVVGPCGKPVTRIGSPRDPFGHRHHLSLWIGHRDVGGHDFWSPGAGTGRIVHDRVVKLEDGERASLTVRAAWKDSQGNALLTDERVWTVTPLHGAGEYALDLALTLTPTAPTLSMGVTPFGLVAVRVARTMGVRDGGGRITNSEGRVNEREVLWQRARWCDYSGPAAPGLVVNGIALFDHPKNPSHPTYFHVRDDGFMTASLTYGDVLEIAKERPLKLRYRFWIHRGGCDPAETEAQWKRWAQQEEETGGPDRY